MAGHAYQGSDDVVREGSESPLSYYELLAYVEMDVKSNSQKVFKDAKRMAKELMGRRRDEAMR